RDYYHLYIPFFDRTASTIKMATNLADVYYLLGEYLKSGDQYLRIYQNEYGKSPNRKAVIENAILALQKDKSVGFYEKVRAKGLLLKAVTRYQASSPDKKNDPKLELLRLKTEYEQGFLPKAIEDLFAFARARPNTHQAIDAADIIMDHFNTLNDFQGLQFWADKLIALKLPGTNFRAKLTKIKSQAKSKLVQEKVKAISGYDEFSEGKSYLAAALQSNDMALKDAAIQEALAKSKREHDFTTFLEAANALAKNEKNPQKRASILRSIAQENIKVGKFYTGIAKLREAAADPALDPATKRGLMDDSVNTAIMLHDSSALVQAVNDAQFAQVSAPVKGRVRDQIADALDSPVELRPEEVSLVFKTGLTEEVLLGLFKARNKLDARVRARVDTEVAAHCGSQSRQLVCLWSQFSALERVRAGALKILKTASTDLKSLEAFASQFMETSRRYQILEGAGDPHLETAVSIRGRELYSEFAGYLNRVANANPTLKNEILQKVRESQGSAQVYEQKCITLSQKVTAINPAMKYCSSKTFPTLENMLYWGKGLTANASHTDSASGDSENLQKSVFSSDSDPEPMLKLAAYYFENQKYHHAAALSGYGTSLYKAREPDFKVILGCSLLKLGYLTEAGFHLRSAGDYQNRKAACLNALQKLRLP
ncbi:MAG: hypothetical protein H7333_08915, partial [Bdellovibrionales bacterium]|nr:hypothetical protein [Oligoflexia bacterium]